jgi:hypothetical protein
MWPDVDPLAGREVDGAHVIEKYEGADEALGRRR